EREGVAGLARRLGYSSRHLTRLLTVELGAGPLALARAHRAHTARMLLVGTDMPISDVAFSAGFASIRQCNDTIREVFEMTPGQLRATRRPSLRLAGDRSGQAAGSGTRNSEGADAGAQGLIDLLLPHRTPLDATGVFAWMAARALPGMESSTATSFARHLRMPGGPVHFEIRQDTDGRLRLRAR